MRPHLLFLCASIFVLGACSTNKKINNQDGRNDEKTATIVGADRDEHGCIGSAGYTWSEALQTCIRLWEDAVRLSPSDGSNPSSYEGADDAFIVFSADSAKVELITGPDNRRQLLDRRPTSNGYVWNAADDDTPNVRFTNGKWIVEKRGKTVYQER